MTHSTEPSRPVHVATALRAGLVASALLLCGCTGGPPSVVLDTSAGAVPLTASAPAMPGGSVGPPPNMDTTASGIAQPVDRNGSYTGTAEPLNTGGGMCTQTQRTAGFVVRGTSVRYNGFRGRIAADGGLQMVYGSDWIIGQFDGANFHGQLAMQGRFGAPGCTYILNLQRTGS